MTGSAARAAVKFTGCAVIAAAYGVALFMGDGALPWRLFMYTVAAGVCIRILWPNQEDGDALIASAQPDKTDGRQ